MGPYISNYILSELALDKKVRESGNYMVHIFPENVKEMPWVKLFVDCEAVVYFIKYHPLSFESVRALRLIFKRERINIIHCQFGGWDIDAKLAAPFTRMLWHQRMSVNLDKPLRRFKYWFKYNIAGMYKTENIAISQAVYDAISSITCRKVYCIPNAIDFERLKVEQHTHSSHQNGAYKLLMFAYSPYVKGLDIAYKACEILNKKGIPVELSVVSQSNSDEIIAQTYDPRPDWLKILRPTSNVSEYYFNTDSFLSASRSEGFSNSLLESIYCGCPVYYSDIPGTSWASQFKHTVVYKVNSPEDLANKIEEYRNIKITLDEINFNRSLAHDKYSMSTWVEKIYNIYKIR